MRPVGGTISASVRRRPLASGRYLRERWTSSLQEKKIQSPHFSSSEWCFWRRTSLSRNSSNGKSPRRFSLAFITSAKPEKGGHRLCLNRAWVRFPPSHAPPLQLSPPCPSKETLDSLPPPPLFSPRTQVPLRTKLVRSLVRPGRGPEAERRNSCFCRGLPSPADVTLRC